MKTRCVSQERHLIRFEGRIAVSEKTEDGWVQQRRAGAEGDSQTRAPDQGKSLGKRRLVLF